MLMVSKWVVHNFQFYFWTVFGLIRISRNLFKIVKPLTNCSRKFVNEMPLLYMLFSHAFQNHVAESRNRLRSKKLYIYLFFFCKYIKVSNKMILEVGVEYDLVENHKSCSSNGTQNHG